MSPGVFLSCGVQRAWRAFLNKRASRALAMMVLRAKVCGLPVRTLAGVRARAHVSSCFIIMGTVLPVSRRLEGLVVCPAMTQPVVASIRHNPQKTAVLCWDAAPQLSIAGAECAPGSLRVQPASQEAPGCHC